MKMLRLVVCGLMVCALTAAVRSDEKKADNAKLLVGSWEVTKADKGTVAVGTVVEFTKDGKMKIEDKERKLEGTYTVEGDKFTFAVKVDGEERKRTITIKKISETELSTVDADGKAVTFKKKPA